MIVVDISPTIMDVDRTLAGHLSCQPVPRVAEFHTVRRIAYSGLLLEEEDG